MGYPIDGIGGDLNKEEGLPTHSELFSLIFLAPKQPLIAS